MTLATDTIMGSTRVVILAPGEDALRGSAAEFRHFGTSPVVRTEIVSALADVVHDPSAVLVVSSELPCLELRDVLDLAVAACETAVIFGLTASTAPEAVALALGAGVRATVDLPLTPERIAHTLRTLPVSAPKTGPVVLGDLVVDETRHSVAWSGVPVDLTPREFALVSELARAHPGLVTLDDLAEVYGSRARDPRAAVRVAITHIRTRIAAVAGPQGQASIETIRGVGYRLAP